MSTPRACSYKGQTLRRAVYELGSGTQVYSIGKYNPFISPGTVRAFDDTSSFECLDGTTAIDHAIYDFNDKSVHIEMEVPDQDRCERTVIRHCDAEDQLYEMYLNIEVTTPRFSSFVRQHFEIPI